MKNWDPTPEIFIQKIYFLWRCHKISDPSSSLNYGRHIWTPLYALFVFHCIISRHSRNFKSANLKLCKKFHFIVFYPWFIIEINPNAYQMWEFEPMSLMNFSLFPRTQTIQKHFCSLWNSKLLHIVAPLKTVE
jgi:hypothetical protein